MGELPPIAVALRRAALDFADSWRAWLIEGRDDLRPAAVDRRNEAERRLQENAVRFALPGVAAATLYEGFLVESGDLDVKPNPLLPAPLDADARALHAVRILDRAADPSCDRTISRDMIRRAAHVLRTGRLV